MVGRLFGKFAAFARANGGAELAYAN